MTPELLGQIVQGGIAVVVAWLAYQSKQTSEKTAAKVDSATVEVAGVKGVVQEIHTTFDGKMDLLLKLVGEAARKEGVEAGKAEAHAEVALATAAAVENQAAMTTAIDAAVGAAMADKPTSEGKPR